VTTSSVDATDRAGNLAVMTESEDDEKHEPAGVLEEAIRSAGDENVVEITEEFAGRALARLKSQATLPEVAVDPRQVAATLRKAQSRVLWVAIMLFAASTTVGLLVITGASLEDWYMHVGMYIVIFSFFAIYLKAHLAKQRVMRHFYAGLTVFMKIFFAGILHDLVEAREVLDGTETVVRAALPWLDVAAGLLMLSAVALTLHWLVLKGRRDLVTLDVP
jgi:hypothetical protein